MQTSRHCVATGEEGVSETTGVRLSYTNTLIHSQHRVVLGGWFQDGDIVDGSGAEKNHYTEKHLMIKFLGLLAPPVHVGM